MIPFRRQEDAGRPAKTRSRLFVASAALAGLLACDGDPEPPPAPPEAAWTLELMDAEPAFLAVAQAGDDLIAIGGPLAGGGAPAVYRRDGKTWAPTNVPATWRGAAWWAWASSASDVWVVGEDLQVARGSVGSLAMMPTPPVASSTKATLFGVWGSGPNDVWMVGGSATDRTGPQGILLHYDGSSIEKVELTGSASVAAEQTLFKVWGSGPSDVMVVGAGGVAVAYDGTAWALADTGTTKRLLTVHGRGAEKFAVGGFGNGVVLRHDGFSWRDMADPEMPGLNGVFAVPGGDLWVCGVSGYVARHDGTAWHAVDTGVLGRDFHGMFVSDRGAFAAGGVLAVQTGTRRGIIGRFGAP